ncbi:restriction endonuclease subunit S [Streptomyces sp. NPDC059818]|uniref:restriction endonuclease subunit S n=1 Tax=Streptomyces sp. NPDC059818 TaxID=3346962 RepID=UPI003662C17C
MELPAGWVSVSLDEVAEVSGGIQKQQKRRPVKNVFPFLRVANVGRGSLDLSVIHEVELFDGEIDRFRLQSGDLLVVEGNGSPDQIGRAATWRDEIKDAVHQNHLIRVRPGGMLSSKYLELVWNSRLVSDQLMRVAQSTSGLYTLSTSKLKRVELPLPPLAEQHRIVEALEGHLSRLDAAVGLMGQARRRSRVLTRSVVERAQSGNLAGPEESDGSADSLLANIAGLSEGATSMKRRKSSTFHPLSGSVSLPAHWSVRPLGDLCSLIEYGTSAKAHSEPSGGDVPVLRMGNIQNGRLDWGNLKYLSGGQDGIDKLLLNDGDILFNRTNSAELVGKAAVYRAVNGPATFASYLIRCRTWPGVDPDWVALCINSAEGRRYINSVVSQQVGQANVNGTKLSSFPIMLPPSNEQTRIVRNAEEWNDSVARAGALVAQSLKWAGHLRQSVLNRAFTGALVPQDPADEPAATLLARIQADRAAQPKAKRSRRTPAAPRKAKAPAISAPAPTPAPTHAVQQEFDL